MRSALAREANRDGASLISEPVLKLIPEDFVVEEVPRFQLLPPESNMGKFRIIQAWKRQLTTFEALRIVASAVGLDSCDIGYAGLKDEDAITRQFFSIPVGTPAREWNAIRVSGSRLTVTEIGVAQEPLSVGDLHGNCFRVVIRNIGDGHVRVWPREGTQYFEFLNYYDTQRFGVPGKPLLTHLIGEHLVKKDERGALDLLIESGSPESQMATAHVGSAEAFFAGLDSRVVSFYKSAHYSSLWNAAVGKLVAEVGSAMQIGRGGMTYCFPTQERVGTLPLTLPYTTVRVVAGQPTTLERDRLLRVGTAMYVGPVEPDDMNPGRCRSSLSFFLPSGAYATMAVAQFLSSMGSATDA